jgi:hypothetical protein
MATTKSHLKTLLLKDKTWSCQFRIFLSSHSVCCLGARTMSKALKRGIAHSSLTTLIGIFVAVTLLT